MTLIRSYRREPRNLEPFVEGARGQLAEGRDLEEIWGYRPIWTVPWDWVSAGVGFTMAVCLVAGILPARRAARSNIIDALQTT